MGVAGRLLERNGTLTVDGVLLGYRLIRVGNVARKHPTWGAIYKAMHGDPGETRKLVREPDGNRSSGSRLFEIRHMVDVKGPLHSESNR
jgi:hypothetical protein